MTFYFSLYNWLPQVWVALAVVLLAGLWLMVVLRRRLMLLVKASKKSVAEPAAYPPVSVVVYSCSNAEALEAKLNHIFSQDYPAPFEVLVVNDINESEIEDVVTRMSLVRRNLRLTFIPDNARNLSRKKLAISLGLKAAANEAVVLTTTDAVNGSQQWLRAMARPFAEGKQVVLGYAEVKGLRGAMKLYDEAVVGAKWLTAALRGKPYRGTGDNIAYLKSLFFNKKGFAETVYLVNGDDDLFIRSVATGDNCSVVLRPEATLSVTTVAPDEVYREQRLQHAFTARFLPKGSSRFFGFSMLVLWLWLAAEVVGIAFALPNILAAIPFVLLLPAVPAVVAKSWRKAAVAMQIPLSSGQVLRAVWFRWLLNFRIIAGSRRSYRHNYTWVKR